MRIEVEYGSFQKEVWQRVSSKTRRKMQYVATFRKQVWQKCSKRKESVAVICLSRPAFQWLLKRSHVSVCFERLHGSLEKLLVSGQMRSSFSSFRKRVWQCYKLPHFLLVLPYSSSTHSAGQGMVHPGGQKLCQITTTEILSKFQAPCDPAHAEKVILFLPEM